MKGVTKITRNGTEYWYARVDGRRVYCGKDDKGYKLAIKARQKFEVKQYENREMTAGLKVKKVKFRTVRDMFNWYMTLPSVQKQKSYQRKVIASKRLLDYFGNRPVHAVKADDIERYREYRKATDGTVNVEVALLSAVYYRARKNGDITADMLPGAFPLVRVTNPRPIIPDDDFELLMSNTDQDFADVLLCAYEAAMRAGEICNLRAYQVHLDEPRISNGQKVKVDYIDLGIFDTKTGARRTIPVSPRLKEIIQGRLESLEPEDRIFTNKGKPWYPAAISSKFLYLCKRAGLPHGDNTLNDKGERIGIVFHCLRHTRTTKWVEMGFSDEIIRRATGHRSLEAYQQYVKLDPSAVMRLVGCTNDIKSPETLNSTGI